MTTATEKIDAARALLVDQPDRPVRSRAALGAACLPAVAAILMAGVVVIGPGFTVDETTWAVPPQ